MTTTQEIKNTVKELVNKFNIHTIKEHPLDIAFHTEVEGYELTGWLSKVDGGVRIDQATNQIGEGFSKEEVEINRLAKQLKNSMNKFINKPQFIY